MGFGPSKWWVELKIEWLGMRCQGGAKVQPGEQGERGQSAFEQENGSTVDGSVGKLTAVDIKGAG